MQCRMIGIERHNVGRHSGRQPLLRAQRLRAARKRRIEQSPSDRGLSFAGEQVARTPRQALAVFERAQFLRGVDQDVRIGSCRDPSPGVEIADGGEYPVAQIGFGHWAESRDRAAGCKAVGLAFCQMSRMDQAPAPVDTGMGQQPFDRPCPRKGKARFDFLDLFGGMNVDGAVAPHRDERRKFFSRHCPQAVRRDAEDAVGEKKPLGSVQQVCESVEIAQKASLPGLWRGPAEIGMGIEHGKQGQADARRFGSRDNAPGHLRRVAIARAAHIVMEVVELADPRVARLEHLDIGHRADRLDIVGRQAVEKAVHDFAPAPEIVVPGSAMLGKPRHAALEGMAVDVGKAGQGNRSPLVAGLRRRVRGHGGNQTAGHLDADVIRPAGRQQRGFEPERSHIRFPLMILLCLDIIERTCKSSTR